MQEERTLHEAKLAKMEAEMNLVFQQKVAEKESKLKQSEEELYARHKEMKEALSRQRQELEDKKMRVESGGRLTPENKVNRQAPPFDLIVLILRSRPRGDASIYAHNCQFFWQYSIFFILPRVMLRFTQFSTICLLVTSYLAGTFLLDIFCPPLLSFLSAYPNELLPLSFY